MTSIDDLFPHASRVIYGINPLYTVVCQVRFPTLLRIDAEPPVEFQEAIRDRFPIVERAVSTPVEGVPIELLQAVGAQTSSGYVFRTEDRSLSLVLASDSITIESAQYSRWEDFWSYAEKCLSSFFSIYKPSYLTRVGLRYQNLIRRDDLGISRTNWSVLLGSQIVAELAMPAWESLVTDSRRVVRCVDPTGDAVLFQHGFAQLEGKNEQLYLIDFDFYRDTRLEVGECAAAFDRFHARSGRAFRWSISDHLHGILQPVELPAS